MLQSRASGPCAPTTASSHTVRRISAPRTIALLAAGVVCVLAALLSDAGVAGPDQRGTGAPRPRAEVKPADATAASPSQEERTEGLTSTAVSAVPSVTNPPRRPRATGLVYGFFDDATGARNSRIQIQQVGLEYGRRGFLRVAWRPLAVLEGVRIAIAPEAVWPAAGAQIIGALRSHGELAQLRHVTLQLPGATDVHAASARLRADGALDLLEVQPSASVPSARTAPAALRLWLAGPLAGQCVPLSVTPPTTATRRTTASAASAVSLIDP